MSNTGHSVVYTGLSETESPDCPGWIKQEEPLHQILFLISLTLALGLESHRACGTPSHRCAIQNVMNNLKGSVITGLFSFLIPHSWVYLSVSEKWLYV